MSTIINATTTNGVVIQPDNSGSLILQTNSGTTAITVDTSQNTTLAGKLTTASSGIQFSDSSIQTAASSPYVLKNRIINGAMSINQRAYSGAPAINAGTYTLDRWYCYTNQSSKFTVSQSSTAPAGFSNSAIITSSSAYTVGSADAMYFAQIIEGFNWYDLAWGTASAQTVTLSFWVYSSLTGTFGGALQNTAATRSYPFSYTISSANTWTKISITIPGDTSGTWVGASNAGAVNLTWNLGTAPQFSGTANTWASANYVNATGTTNLVSTNGATLYITGVQLEIGTSATPFERRLYNQELANCQRYFISYGGSDAYEVIAGGLAQSTTSSVIIMSLPVEMRTAPTLGYNSVTSFLINDSSVQNASSAIAVQAGVGTKNLGVNFTTSGITAGRATRLLANNSTSTRLTFSAEL